MSLKSLTIALTVATGGYSLCAPAAAESPMKPGGWEMRTTLSMQDPKSGEWKTMGSSTTKLCLSAEHLEKDPYLKPSIDEEKMKSKGAKCSVSDAKRDGGTASWKAKCETADGTGVEMLVENAVAAEKLSSSMTQTISRDKQTMHARMATEGAYVGECTADMMKL